MNDPNLDNNRSAPATARHNAALCDTSGDSLARDTPDNTLLTDRQRAAIELLVTGASVTAVAQALAVHRGTLHRWIALPEFAAVLRDRRAALTQQSADRFRSLLTAALDTFQKQISDPYVPTAYRAARGLLALAQLNKLLAPTADDTPAGWEGEAPAEPLSDAAPHLPNSDHNNPTDL